MTCGKGQPKRSFDITHMGNVIDRVRWKVLQVREDVSLCRFLAYQTRGTSGNSIVPERVWTIVSVY